MKACFAHCPKEVLEEIRKTNIAVNAVAKKFETP
jgi:hypothetical protein